MRSHSARARNGRSGTLSGVCASAVAVMLTLNRGPKFQLAVQPWVFDFAFVAVGIAPNAALVDAAAPGWCVRGMFV